MKNLLITLLAILAVCACTKKSSPQLVNDFDLSGFKIAYVTPYVVTNSATVYIEAPALVDGTYMLMYDIFEVGTGEVPVAVKDHKGSFKTLPIDIADVYTLKLTRIAKASDKFATLNCSYNFSDSTGLMTATLNGAPFRATHLTSTLSGNQLVIKGIRYAPYSTEWDQVTLTYLNYNYAPLTVDFGAAKPVGTATWQRGYSIDNASTGTSAINAIDPFAGTFTFTTTYGNTITDGAYKLDY